MSASTKDVDAIATAMFNARDNHYSEAALAALRDAAGGIADYFATQNPDFDRDHFITYCGL